LLLLGLVAVAALTALGVWQLHRLAWKQDLIAAVDARIHADPVEAAGPESWGAINAAHDAYRRVRAEGRFLDDRATLVQAATGLGSGYWVMTPFETGNGFTILVNRGFIPADQKQAASPAGAQVVTGLLRITEPKGGFLQANDPAADHWHSRDVAAIAQKRGLAPVAPYFIDADATPGDPDQPVGGLTVIDFPNNHLVYALTWFALAGMAAVGTGFVARDAWKARYWNS